MSELLKTAVKALVQTVFEIVTGPGSDADKVGKIERATEALTSEKASEVLIDKALKFE